MIKKRPSNKNKTRKEELIEKVIEIDRVARTVKGGRRIRFRALVVVGDGKGKVGIGVAKAGDVSQSISKANTYARNHQEEITITNETIPYEIVSRFSSARVILKPAPKGTSVIAGGTVRAVIEAAGIRNVVAKSLGSTNKLNIAKATLLGLTSLNKIAENYKPEIKQPK